jgi:uncharacterized membrane protein YfcA
VTWLWIAAIGIGIGFLGGVFGKGGSAVASPLLLLAGLPPIAAVASPLPSTIPSTIGAADEYRKAGLLDRRVLAWTLACGVPATLVGSIATRWIDGSVLIGATELLLVGIGLRLVWGARPGAGHATPAPASLGAAAAGAIAPSWQLLAVGSVVGVVGGLLANSGGFLLAPLYLSVVRLPIKPALGTSLAVSAVLAIPATIVHASLGHIDWAVAVVLAACALPAARIGARLALRMAPSRLELAFGLALTILGIVTFVA